MELSQELQEFPKNTREYWVQEATQNIRSEVESSTEKLRILTDFMGNDPEKVREAVFTVQNIGGIALSNADELLPEFQESLAAKQTRLERISTWAEIMFEHKDSDIWMALISSRSVKYDIDFDNITAEKLVEIEDSVPVVEIELKKTQDRIKKLEDEKWVKANFAKIKINKSVLEKHLDLSLRKVLEGDDSNTMDLNDLIQAQGEELLVLEGELTKEITFKNALLESIKTGEILPGLHILTYYKKIEQNDVVVDDYLIEELELRTRLYNQLKRAGVRSIQDLISRTEEEVMAIPGLGQLSVDEIYHTLRSRGLSFKDDDPEQS